MAADTYSARLGLLRQATGNNNNNWGDKFNTSVTDLLDLALFGTDSRAVTGGTLDLSTGTQPPAGPGSMIGAVQAFTGALTSQQTVVLPALQGRWTIFNNTTGGFTLIVKTPTGTGIEIPQGTFKDVISDGVNVYRKDRDAVGTLEFMAGVIGGIAPGRILCTGQSLLRSAYPYLFSVIGTTYGAVDGLHFTTPNLADTGRYVRSTSGSIALGTYQANQNAAHTHTYGGTTVTENAFHSHSFSGTTSAMSANATHTHTSNAAATSVNFYQAGGSPASNASAATINATNTDHTHTYSGTTGTESATHAHDYSGTTASSGGTEARPESVAMIATLIY